MKMKDMSTENKLTEKQGEQEAADNYPGVAINSADNEKDDPELVKERTKTLNNNPRNDQ